MDTLMLIKSADPAHRATLRPSKAMLATAVLLAAALTVPLAPASAQRGQVPTAREEGQAGRNRHQRPEGVRRGERSDAQRRQPAADPAPRRERRQPERATERGEQRRDNRAEQRQDLQERRRDARQHQRTERAEKRESRREQREQRRDERIEQRRDAGQEQPEDRREQRNERRDARQDEREERREERRDDRRQAGPADARDRSISEIRGARTTRRDTGGREVIIERGNRRIVRENNHAFIQHDEGERFRRLDRSRVDRRQGDKGRDIVTVERPNGVRIISVYDRNGHLIERRRRRNGRETVLIDNKQFWAGVAAGAAIGALTVTLGEPLVRIPRRRYIVEYGSASEDDLSDALSAEPVETFNRGYALEQIRYSHDLRQRLRRIDLTEIKFESGSWEIGPDQTRKLDRLARVMKRILDRNPDEIFLIEGHTDAVGSDVDNLSLSDRRAESVAVVLTDEYAIPPENLVTQGYGEQYLAVNTEGDEPRNRRVAVRRITPLLASR
jgi:outer membrane protein OmpA-like peptidoglycan-associated protein